MELLLEAAKHENPHIPAQLELPSRATGHEQMFVVALPGSTSGATAETVCPISTIEAQWAHAGVDEGREVLVRLYCRDPNTEALREVESYAEPFNYASGTSPKGTYKTVFDRPREHPFPVGTYVLRVFVGAPWRLMAQAEVVITRPPAPDPLWRWR